MIVTIYLADIRETASATDTLSTIMKDLVSAAKDAFRNPYPLKTKTIGIVLWSLFALTIYLVEYVYPTSPKFVPVPRGQRKGNYLSWSGNG